MNILGLDTSSRFSSVAVLLDETVLLEYNFSSADNISSLLVPSLDFLLKSLKLSLDDIDLFGIGIGPGLFTGIRVGLAALKGFLFGKQKPVVPVVTLLALACKLSESNKTIVPLIDARRGEVYAACYRFSGSETVERIPPMLSKVEELPNRLSTCQSPVFVGSGAEKYNDVLKKQFPQCKIYYRSHFLASEIGRIALQDFKQSRYVLDLQKLLPFYIRRPDAEIHREMKGEDGSGERSHP